MQFADVVAARRMTRHFAEEPIDPATLEAILATSLRAPSAGFTQGVDLVVLTEPTARTRFWASASEEAWRTSPRAEGLMAAPVIIVPVADPDAYVARYGEADKVGSLLADKPASSWPVPYWTVDAAFTVMHLLLAATDLGLGALFFALHGDADVLLRDLGAPPAGVAIGGVLIGHAAERDPRTSPARRVRKEIDELVHRERW